MKKILFIIILICIPFLSVLSSAAQSNDSLVCGSITQGEFTDKRQQINYTIDLAPGDKLTVRGTVVGDFLKFDIQVLAPSGTKVGYSGHPSFRELGQDFLQMPLAETGVLGERGSYSVQIANNDSFGIYTLYVGCILADGTVIEPGDTVPNAALTQAPFSGIGFPGLPPVDFTNAIFLSFNPAAPNSGGIAPGFDAVFGFTFDANSGDTFELSFTRLSGNLNLGLAVLSSDNKIVFQASLVTSDTLSTRFTLPSTGQYTIGVYKIDLLPPASPESTAFQITGVLNP